MHNNYYFLTQLSNQLGQLLEGFTLVSCFSQNKDELIIEFHDGNNSFFIKAALEPAFCCLCFPNAFNRAKKNSIDLFNKALMRKVSGIHQFKNERSFSILLEGSLSLLFKMHGNRANIVLCEDDHATLVFRNHLVADQDLKLSQLDRDIDWSKQAFEESEEKLSSLYFTFGKLIWQWLEVKGFKTRASETRWEEINQLKAILENPTYYIVDESGNLVFSLLPFGKIVKTFSDPILAINEFYHLHSVTGTLNSEKAIIRKKWNDQIKAGRNYIDKNQDKLNSLENDHHYQLWADLIMAHMHEMKTGMESIHLNSFYDNTVIEIKLRKDLNPQKNAEVFYRKAGNKQMEIAKLRESIRQKETEIENWQNSLQTWEGVTDVKELRKGMRVVIGKRKYQEKALPYFDFEHKGFKIWVGKNAEANDQLTLKHAHKDDLWLHAKDVAGSHVIIKYQAGKPFPKDVIERAAQLAAYNSKRKTDTLCPVSVTSKKFVRKRKGDPAGAVVVEREDVILVEPRR